MVIPVSGAAWPVSGLLLACTVLWGFSYVLFTFLLICIDPRLAKLKVPDGCSPAHLANHLTSFCNTLICCSGAIWGLWKLAGQEIPLGSDQLVIGPLIPSSRIYYINQAAYCLYDVIWVFTITRPIQRLMVVHHVLFFVVSLLLLEEDFLPALGPVLLLQEVSSPFVNLFHVFTDFQLKGGLAYTFNAALMTISFFLFRVVFIGLALAQVLYHWKTLGPTVHFARAFILAILGAAYVMQLFWFSKIAGGLVKHLNTKGSLNDGLSDVKLGPSHVE